MRAFSLSLLIVCFTAHATCAFCGHACLPSTRQRVPRDGVCRARVGRRARQKLGLRAGGGGSNGGSGGGLGGATPIKSGETEGKKFHKYLSKVFGVFIIAGSMGLKLPQIMRIWRTRSCIGIAPTGVYSDLLLITVTVIYHALRRYPLTTYGENCVVLVQNCAVVVLMWVFGQPAVGLGGAAAMTALYLAMCALATMLPPKRQPILAALDTPMLLLVNMPQILKNQLQGHTGAMAEMTVVLKLVGSLTRVYTTIHLNSGDRWLLLNYGLSVALNGALLAQWAAMRPTTLAVLRAATAAAAGK